MTYLKIFKKQFLSILNNTGLKILLFVGPIFLTCLFAGVYVNDYVKDISIGILDEDDTTMSHLVGDYFASNERFNVTYYPSTGQQLEELINSGEVQMGLWIPEGFERDVTTYQSSQILAITDGTNIVVSNNAYAQATTIIQTLCAGVEMKLIQGKGVSPSISEDMALIYNVSERILYDSKLTYMNYLVIGFLCVFLQALTLSGMGSMFIRNKDYLAKGNVFQNVLGTNHTVIVLILPSAIASMIVLAKLFDVPMVGNLWVVLLMTVVFLTSLIGPSLIIASIAKDRVKYSQFSFMLSVPTVLSSGVLWPVEQMPKLLEIMIRLTWPLINYAKIVQEIIVKGREFQSVIPNILQMITYGAVWLVIGVLAYKRAFGETDKNQSSQIALANQVI